MLEPKTCERCGAEFHPPTAYQLSPANWAKRRFCGRKCSTQAIWIEKNGELRPTCRCGCGTRVQYPEKKWVRAHKPEWRDLTKHGYIRLYRKGHPMSSKDGLVMEHRYVLYEAGIEIPPGHVVHHVNGKRDDNRLENLQVMAPSEHSLLHIEDRGTITNQVGTFPVVRRSPEEQRRHDRDWMRAYRARKRAESLG